MCVKMRIQGLFRNVPASNSPPLASPILHFPPAGLILGWVPPISAPDALTLRDHAPWMVMGNHGLCSWYRCPWLVLKHLCGYTQLLQWVSAMLLMVFFTRSSSGGPLNSPMDCPKRHKRGCMCISSPGQGFIYVPQLSNLPTTRTNLQIWNTSFHLQRNWDSGTLESPERFCKRDMLPNSEQPALIVKEGLCAALEPKTLLCRRESAPYQPLHPKFTSITTLNQGSYGYRFLSFCLHLSPLSKRQLWKQKSRAWSTSET